MRPEPPIPVLRTVADVRDALADRRTAGASALVPTMGALHAGHLDLIDRARRQAGTCVVSIFVNPTQFGPNEDFSVYPRREAADVDSAARAGADLVFAPPPDVMYPDGHVTRVSVPGLGDRLEGLHRPGFFTGVATVVTKLLLQIGPDIAVFGEKDFQQLQVIRRMVADLDIPVRIDGAPTRREADGLALSSRNAYLSDHERAVAPRLYAALCAMAAGFSQGQPAADLVAKASRDLVTAGFEAPDYLAICRASTLEDVTTISDLAGDPGRVLAAVRLGTTRLIDNRALADDP